MLIPLLELILHFNAQISHVPPEPHYDPQDVAESTIAYLNLYRQTQEMLNKLGAESNKILLGMRRRQDVLP